MKEEHLFSTQLISQEKNSAMEINHFEGSGRNKSKSSLRDPKSEREEHLFSTQLISQEKNSAMEINHFEGSGPEWLMPRGTPFFCF